MLSKKWLGQDPYRVWKNRMRGTRLNVWQQDYNDPLPGQEWEYPEFKGYFANLYWAVLDTQEGDVTVVTDTDDLFLRLYTPQDGINPGGATAPFPAGDISFLHGIAPIGTKFKSANLLGPESQQNQTNASYEGTLYFYFGEL